jgi:S-adenosylmethionine decarboxylase
MSVIDDVSPTLHHDDAPVNAAPFEGPEKLLEIWFGPSADLLPKSCRSNAKLGLRAVDREIWEDMLEIVKCKVLNAVEGVEVDAYLLRYISYQSSSISAQSDVCF